MTNVTPDDDVTGEENKATVTNVPPRDRVEYCNKCCKWQKFATTRPGEYCNKCCKWQKFATTRPGEYCNKCCKWQKFATTRNPADDDVNKLTVADNNTEETTAANVNKLTPPAIRPTIMTR